MKLVTALLLITLCSLPAHGADAEVTDEISTSLSAVLSSNSISEMASCQTVLGLGDPAFRLGIGVQVEAIDGSRFVGLSPYAGSVHIAIVDALIKDVNVRRIEWMGESRHRIDSSGPVFAEGNETSGHFTKIRESGVRVGNRIVAVANSVEKVPLSRRTTDFRSYPYDPQNKRLARELQHVKGDVRHTILNSLQIITSFPQLAHRKRYTLNEKRVRLAFLKEKHASDVTLVRWLLLNLLEEGRIDGANFEVINSLLNVISKDSPTIEEISVTDPAVLEDAIQEISKIVNPNLGLMKVDIYKIR